MVPSPYLTYLGLLAIWLGPILLIIQRNSVTPVEKFIYISMMSPSAFIVSFLMYSTRKKLINNTFTDPTREQKLNQLKQNFRTIFYWLVIGSVLLLGSVGWILFGLT
jgi:hypothetical protein